MIQTISFSYESVHVWHCGFMAGVSFFGFLQVEIAFLLYLEKTEELERLLRGALLKNGATLDFYFSSNMVSHSIKQQDCMRLSLGNVTHRCYCNLFYPLL